MKVSLINTKRVPKIFVCRKAMNKMKEYIRQVDKEVGWLGTVVRDNGNYIIEDVYLFKQEVHSTTTEITVDGLNEFAMDLLQQEDGFEIWNKMKMWGHSHVNMSTSPSAQDNEQMKVFQEGNDDFFIRLITNKQGIFTFDIYDFILGISYENVGHSILENVQDINRINALKQQINTLTNELNTLQGISVEEQELIASEIKEKVKIKNYVNYAGNKYTGVGGYTNYNDYNNWWEDNYYNKKQKNSGKKVTAQEVFSQMSEDDIFNAMSILDSEATLEGAIENEMSYQELIDLEELIEIYCNQHEDKYVQWQLTEMGY